MNNYTIPASNNHFCVRRVGIADGAIFNSSAPIFATYAEAEAHVAKYHNSTRDYVIYSCQPIRDTRNG